MKRLWNFASAGTILVLMAAASSAQEHRTFPLRGVVSCPGKPGLYVRRVPPEVTAFSYKLTDPICGVRNGSEFIALEESYLANGEIWFKVYFAKVTKPIGHCPPQLSGWMIAKLKDRWAVSILEQNVALRSPQTVAQTTLKPSAAAVKVEEGTSFKPLLDYFLLLLGTALAVCVVSIERAKNIRIAHWANSLVAFEFLALSAVNLFVAALLIDQLSQVPEPNLLFHLFRIVQGSPGGFALLGFLLAVVLMKFMSFAKSS